MRQKNGGTVFVVQLQVVTRNLSSAQIAEGVSQRVEIYTLIWDTLTYLSAILDLDHERD
jgi:hypothetical protein